MTNRHAAASRVWSWWALNLHGRAAKSTRLPGSLPASWPGLTSTPTTLSLTPRSCEAGGRAFADEVGFAVGKELYADRRLSTSARHISQEIAEGTPLGRRAC